MTKVLVSTDIGSDIDDALSILVMFNQGIDIDAIYTVNDRHRVRPYIAKHLVDLSGKPIDVLEGDSLSLTPGITPWWFMEEYYVEDNFIDKEATDERVVEVVYQAFEKVGILTNGAEDMARRLQQEKYIILSLGPLTTIARAITEYPEAAKGIEHLYIMGTSSVRLEHNVRFDPDAANIVLAADIPITLIPGDVCSRRKLPVSILDQLETPAGKYVDRMARGFLAAKTAQNFRTYGAQNLLPKSLKQIVERDCTVGKVDPSLYPHVLEVMNLKQRMVTNLDDMETAAFSGAGYFKTFRDLQELLRSEIFKLRQGSSIANIMDSLPPTQLSVADVYVPYCFSHPEKLVVEYGTATVDEAGKSFFAPGDKHRIVKDLDFDHFVSFAQEYLK